jgi:hypothetical protein
MNTIHTETYRGLTIKLYHDPDPESPREWDNLGVMFCKHRRYNLGDKNAAPPPNANVVRLPLYLYDHSGITISTRPFSCPWDSGQVGFIYCTHEKIRQEYDLNPGPIPHETIERVVAQLEQEVRTYDQFLRGKVYGFVVEDQDGESLDSMWGFYQNERPDADDSYVLMEARESAAHHADKIEKTETETQIAECCP